MSQIAVARTVREAPAQTSDGLNSLWDSANETFAALNSAFLNIVDARSNAELLEKVQTHFKSLANEVETNVAKLSEEVNAHNKKELMRKFSK